MSVHWQQAPIDDRGLAFGDGCFETLRLHEGRAPFWAQHKQRLLTGLQRLNIKACPHTLEHILAEAISISASGVLKIIVTRGAGGRGYNGLHLQQPNYYPRVFPFQPMSPELYSQGLVVGESRIRLGKQPFLAGIKHLNRLEQVLARHEAVANGWDETLLRNQEGQPVELTAMNLFLRYDQGWWTSALENAGVNGIARQWVINQSGVKVRVSEQAPDSVDHIIEAFACNSIMGILPLRALGQWQGEVGAQTLSLQQQWNNLWHDKKCI